MFIGIRYNLEGNKSTEPPMILSRNRAVAITMAAHNINGEILRVTKHWSLVGSGNKRVLVCLYLK